MLLVNNVSLDINTPKFLMHAAWNKGIYIADFVFPWFLFCIGVAIPFSFASYSKKGLPGRQYIFKVLKRTIILIGLGCLLTSSIVRQPVFYLDVLQLIGLAYMVGALLYFLPGYARLIIAFVFLTAYWAIIKFVPIPGIGVGIFEENTNILKHFNEVYLLPLHLKGLTSVIPTASLVLIATYVGDFLKNPKANIIKKTLLLLSGGVILISIGTLWNIHLPYNKPYWTSSYILVMAGSAIFILLLLHLIIDVVGFKIWSFPFVVFGSNAIFAYVAPILFKVWIFQGWYVVDKAGSKVVLSQWFLNFFINHWGKIAGGWLYTISYIVFWWLVCLIMYRKKIFLKV